VTTLYQPPAALDGARGRYQLTAFLGRGGFGESYRAQAEDGTEVTVKVLRLERLDSWKSLELFEREARALAALSHPRIPRFVELFVSDGGSPRPLGSGETVTGALAAAPGPGVRVVLVQSFVPGRSLQSKIDAGERLDPAAAERLARDLLDVLEYLHARAGEQPFIHRDLKPSNVIVDAEGRAHLIDFGAIQMRVRAAGESGSTMIGTVGYFPHEQILGRAVPSSDLYALGMTLLVAMNGLPPEEQPVDPHSHKARPPAGLPAPLFRFLDAVLEPSPGTRPSTAAQARAILDGKYLPARRGKPPIVALPPEREARQRWLYRIVGGGALAATALLHTVLFNRFSETELVTIAPFWVGPLVFGAAGLLALPRKNSLAIAITSAVVGLVGLYFFLYGIFPSL
jgi:serine/threonine protein kinase